ncbi:unnamed protein product [Closterium sp. NIES-64]|nr:unnamed protein product [Closterium sp. NIES-64]
MGPTDPKAGLLQPLLTGSNGRLDHSQAKATGTHKSSHDRILSNSLAVLTDAAHLLSDIASFAISLFALWMAGWEATPRHTFGYHRMEILGALVSMQLIWMITGILLYEAVSRLISQTESVDGRLMFITSAFGVGVNHSASSPAEAEPARARNINLEGAYLHVLGDLLQSIGVMVGGAVIWYNPEWYVLPSSHCHRLNLVGRAVCHLLLYLDSTYAAQARCLVHSPALFPCSDSKIVDLICTLLFSILVLVTTYRMLRDVIDVLMESTPRGINASEVEAGLKTLPGVEDVHELHIWALTLGKVMLACHVRIDAHSNPEDVLNSVLRFCERTYRISHATVQVERSRVPALQGSQSAPDIVSSPRGAADAPLDPLPASSGVPSAVS